MTPITRREAPDDLLATPPAPHLARTALFADLDGTLAPIEATPQAVGPDAARRRLIDALISRLVGRFAVISGRSLADIDRVLEGRVAAVAAVHGLVRRNADGRLVATKVDVRAMAVALDAARDFGTRHPGVIIEDKGSALALHYRLAPAAGPTCLALAQRLAAELPLEIQPGDMVVELKSCGPNKGAAIRAFMSERPFAGHTPVFLGDDLTDEHGFEAVQALGGFGIVVGRRRPTAARYALADVTATRAWLHRALAAAAP